MSEIQAKKRQALRLSKPENGFYCTTKKAKNIYYESFQIACLKIKFLLHIMLGMQGEESSSASTLIAFLWIGSLVIVAVISYLFGKAAVQQKQAAQEVTSVSTAPTQPVAQGPAGQSPLGGASTPPSPTIDLEKSCDVSGPAQKKEYLTPYILKEGDNFQKIAENELHDATRVSELTALNDDQRQLTVGSTIYLPPDSIKQSSGHIAQVSGKIVKKDNAQWQLTYGGGEKGPGIWMPGFWFKNIANASDFQIGDCVTVLFDNGVKVYTVTKSS